LKALTIVDVITEIVIILLPIVPLRNLHMPRKYKFFVVLAFALRIPYVDTKSKSHSGMADFETVEM
jgi:hypothetical protein